MKDDAMFGVDVLGEMKRIVTLLSLWAACLVAPFASAGNAEEIVIAQWNVENLYDATNDPSYKGDDEFTPSGWTRWTNVRYRMKLTNIAEIASCMKPDIFCVEEVENIGVINDLREIMENVFHWPMPEVVHRESNDPRGIDCAILSRYKPAKVKWISFGAGTRHSPFVDFVIDGRRLVVCGNHWKSRFGNPKISNAKREVQADKVRATYQKRLEAEPDLAIVLTGDFNDGVLDRVPLECGPFRTNMVQVLEDGISLFCLSSLLPENKRGTFFYSQTKTWHSFDTINVSRGLLPEGNPASPWVVDFDSYQIFAPERIRMGEYGAPFPARRVGTPSGHKFLYGYSDHFPVLVRIKPR